MGDCDSTSLEFIIVGASVSGLASAIALKESGHRVLVLEKEARPGGAGSVPNGSGCAQLPPNAGKILSDWGLDDVLRANSSPVSGFTVYKYDPGTVSPDFIGTNLWDKELLSEARGGYVQLSHRELVRILYEFAIKPSKDDISLVSVKFGAEVVNIDCEACTVTTKNGEVHTADGIIGADGANGIVRRALIEGDGSEPDSGTFTGISAYNTFIPRTRVLENDLDWLFNFPNCTLWMGPNRALRTFPLGKDSDLSLTVYTPDISTQHIDWNDEAEMKLTDVLGSCDKAIRKLAAVAEPATCIRIKEYHDLESWVSESGRVLVVGDAAHPSAPASMHSYSCSLEDGVFLGKLFSHTQNTERVPEFFHAFEGQRQTRCTRIRQAEKEALRIILLTEGPDQAAVEASMREQQGAGGNVLEGLQNVLDDFVMVYGYNARDDADEYWMSWGRYHDMKKDTTDVDKTPIQMTFSSLVEME